MTEKEKIQALSDKFIVKDPAKQAARDLKIIGLGLLLLIPNVLFYGFVSLMAYDLWVLPLTGFSVSLSEICGLIMFFVVVNMLFGFKKAIPDNTASQIWQKFVGKILATGVVYGICYLFWMILV